MPVFDWIRTDLYKELEDGSIALFYEKAKVENMAPMELVRKINENPEFTMPGWETERLNHLSKLFEAYKNVTEEDLWDHLQYFLEQIILTAEMNDIKMAIHPDDPPWSIFGLPRIITNRNNIKRLKNLVDNPYNGVTLCSGSLSLNPNNNVAEMVRGFAHRISFAHIRNVRVYENGDFTLPQLLVTVLLLEPMGCFAATRIHLHVSGC